MLETIAELQLNDTTDVRTLAERLGRFLELDGPAPLAATRRAVVDARYAGYLAGCRGNPPLLAVLLADPENRPFADEAPEAAPAPAPPAAREAPAFSSAELVLRAGKALGAWAAGGFETLPEEEFLARFAACEACDHLVAPPDRLLYRLTLGKRVDPRVCSGCGCTASRKARVATERCPIPDPADPAVNRWGQPLALPVLAG